MDAAISTVRSTTPDDHAGRWIGGVLGAGTSLAVAAAAAIMGSLQVMDAGWLSTEFLVFVGLLGAPIGWILGRTALPLARGGGWVQALAVGFGIAWLAPPMGAAAWIVVALVEDGFGSTDCGSSVLKGVLLLPVIAMYSYLALVATIPVGLLWGILVRLVPAAALRDARMPPLIARFGTRHLLGLLVIAIAVLGVAQLVAPSVACR